MSLGVDRFVENLRGIEASLHHRRGDGRSQGLVRVGFPSTRTRELIAEFGDVFGRNGRGNLEGRGKRWEEDGEEGIVQGLWGHEEGFG